MVLLQVERDRVREAAIKQGQHIGVAGFTEKSGRAARHELGYQRAAGIRSEQPERPDRGVALE